jgi:hypothetical protein
VSDAARLLSALKDAQSLINALAKKVDWGPIPGTWARDCSRIRNYIGKVIAESEPIE